jgi:hypothetical protein
MKLVLRHFTVGIFAAALASAFAGCGGDDSTGGGTGGSGGSGGSATGGSSGSGGSATGGGGGSGGSGTGGEGTGGSVVDDSGAGGSTSEAGTGGAAVDDGGTGGGSVTDAALSDGNLADGGTCPESAPAEGMACTDRGICTYGTTSCRCSRGGDGGLDWACFTPVGPGDGGNPTGCPATKPGDTTECAEAGKGLFCQYQSGDCLCANRGGMPNWRCF